MKRLVAAASLLTAVLAAPAEARLRFEPCGNQGYECATLTAPLDYDEPSGAKIKLAVTRLPAVKKSRGPLMINYGGPGAGAVGITKQIGAGLFGAYRDHFDLVALDPRGTGENAVKLDCRVDQSIKGVYRRPFARPEPVSAGEQIKLARAYAQRCVRRNKQIASHVSTANVARDMDLLREQLGESEISYFGFSYGTMLGATYAAMFGEHLRAAVLDGALDPQTYLVDPVTGLSDQTSGFETALARYFGACRAAPKSACKWTRGKEPREAYDQLIVRANRKPIAAPDREVTMGHREPVTGDEINYAIAGELYAKQLWPEMTQALDQAARGNASLMRAGVDSSDGRRSEDQYDPALDRYFMIGAAEQAYGNDPQVIIDLEAENTEAYPHFFFNSGFAQVPYTLFTARDEDAFLGPFELSPRTPKVLVVGTTFDPATPYAGAQDLVKQLGRARLLTMKGDGHTAYGGNSKCIDRAVDRYVLKVKLPPAGLQCRQHVPFPLPLKAKASASTAAAVVRRAAPSAPLSAPFAGVR